MLHRLVGPTMCRRRCRLRCRLVPTFGTGEGDALITPRWSSRLVLFLLGRGRRWADDAQTGDHSSEVTPEALLPILACTPLSSAHDFHARTARRRRPRARCPTQRSRTNAATGEARSGSATNASSVDVGVGEAACAQPVEPVERPVEDPRQLGVQPALELGVLLAEPRPR